MDAVKCIECRKKTATVWHDDYFFGYCETCNSKVFRNTNKEKEMLNDLRTKPERHIEDIIKRNTKPNMEDIEMPTTNSKEKCILIWAQKVADFEINRNRLVTLCDTVKAFVDHSTPDKVHSFNQASRALEEMNATMEAILTFVDECKKNKCIADKKQTLIDPQLYDNISICRKCTKDSCYTKHVPCDVLLNTQILCDESDEDEIARPAPKFYNVI